jgi:hypothetical protein
MDTVGDPQVDQRRFGDSLATNRAAKVVATA